MNDSSIAGISVRAILATVIVLACCGLAIMQKDMSVLKDLALVAVSFYFGQKSIQGGSSNAQSSTVNPDGTQNIGIKTGAGS